MFSVVSWLLAIIACSSNPVTGDAESGINIKVRVLAVSEMGLSEEFSTDEDAVRYFNGLFKQVQNAFDEITDMNITIELKRVIINKEASDQPYLDTWTYENETFRNPPSILSFYWYVENSQRSWKNDCDVIIVFTRIPEVAKDRSTGMPVFASYRNLSVNGHPIVSQNFGFRIGKSIMPPDPKIAAYEFAYFLGSPENSEFLTNSSEYANPNCTERFTQTKGYILHEYLRSDPNGPFSTCALLRIKEKYS